MTPSQMHAEAEKHEGRYLLRRRFGRDRAKDQFYIAADWLVDHGYAFWLDAYSSMAPGIQLTGKPGPVDPGQPTRSP